MVVISGDENETTKKRARDSGANDFIGKTADAPEVLARIDNLLRLVEAKVEVAVSREAVQTTAMRDPITGVFTPQYLLTEGRKHFSHAKRHGGPLSIVILRVDSYAEIEQAVGRDVAGKLLARIAGLLTSSAPTSTRSGTGTSGSRRSRPGRRTRRCTGAGATSSRSRSAQRRKSPSRTSSAAR